jgi:hypothetical protein
LIFSQAGQAAGQVRLEKSGLLAALVQIHFYRFLLF